MNTMVKLPDSRWPGWRRRLYWWMHEAVEAGGLEIEGDHFFR
ncbi:hypothetical protein ACV344_34555, partial [Pseudomonas aeruginosa]